MFEIYGSSFFIWFCFHEDKKKAEVCFWFVRLLVLVEKTTEWRENWKHTQAFWTTCWIMDVAMKLVIRYRNSRKCWCGGPRILSIKAALSWRTVPFWKAYVLGNPTREAVHERPTIKHCIFAQKEYVFFVFFSTLTLECTHQTFSCMCLMQTVGTETQVNVLSD